MLTQQDMDIVKNFADCGMSTTAVGEILNNSANTVWYHLDKVRQETGLNPWYFWDLVELLQKYIPQWEEKRGT